MSKVLIIGCGGVAGVAIHKCCQNSEVFTEICIASRTKSKCDDLKAKLEGTTSTKITTAQVDADSCEPADRPDQGGSARSGDEHRPALSGSDHHGCLPGLRRELHGYRQLRARESGRSQWKAAYEKRCKEEGFSAYFDYSWQWAYKEKFEKAGLTALLGSGFDPGVTQAYCASGPEAPVRHHRHHRYSGLQRRRPRLSLRHQLQPGDQPA